MSDLWTPPPGFFPSAVTWFHQGNIDRFEPIWRKSHACYWDLTNHALLDVTPVCDGSAVGKTCHIWKDSPPTREFWGTITGCVGDGYQCSALEEETLMAAHATIGTGVPATVLDFADAFDPELGFSDPFAVRYGWVFSLQQLIWWRRNGTVMHWLGPPP